MAQRATSLGPKPSLFIIFFCFFGLLLFLSLLCNTKKTCFPPRKGHFLFILECLPLFLLSFFGAPPFSISLSLSLSFLLFCLFSFLSFFFAFFWFLVFVSFFLFLSSLLFFLQRNNIKIFNCKFFSSIFSFFWFPVFVFLSSPFFLSCFFADLKLCFCSTSLFLVSKKTKLKKTPIFSQKGGLQQNGFFMTLCFAKCEKLSFFLGHFLGKFWLMFKTL